MIVERGVGLFGFFAGPVADLEVPLPRRALCGFDHPTPLVPEIPAHLIGFGLDLSGKVPLGQGVGAPCIDPALPTVELAVIPLFGAAPPLLWHHLGGAPILGAI